MLHYTFIISQLWLTSHPRSTVVLRDTGTPGTSREIYSEDAAGETRTRNNSVSASSGLTIGIFTVNFSTRTRNPSVSASPSMTIGILTVNFSTGTRSSCVQYNHCTSRMRSQPQLRNDKYILMQRTNWINSTPSQQ